MIGDKKATSKETKNERGWDYYSPSFDINRIRKDIQRGDNIQAVIRGHLYAEFVLSRCISIRLQRPKALILERMDYHNIVRFAISLGIIPDEVKGCLLFLNTLRNNFAHNLEYEISQTTVEEFRNTVRKGLRSIIDDAAKKYSRVRKKSLQNFISGLVLTLDIWRHIGEQEKKDLEFQQHRLQRILDRTNRPSSNGKGEGK